MTLLIKAAASPPWSCLRTAGLSGWKHGLCILAQSQSWLHILLASMWLVSSLSVTQRLAQYFSYRVVWTLKEIMDEKCLAQNLAHRKYWINVSYFNIMNIDWPIIFFLPISPWLCMCYELYLFKNLFLKICFGLWLCNGGGFSQISGDICHSIDI